VRFDPRYLEDALISEEIFRTHNQAIERTPLKAGENLGGFAVQC
jgi:hypothetical protein